MDYKTTAVYKLGVLYCEIGARLKDPFVTLVSLTDFADANGFKLAITIEPKETENEKS